MKKIRKNYRLNPKLVELIRKAAAETGYSNTAIVEKALEQLFNQHDCHGLKLAE